MKTPQGIVAILMAGTLIVFILGTITVDVVHPDRPVDPNEAEAWKVILATLIGALSGYVAGGKEK